MQDVTITISIAADNSVSDADVRAFVNAAIEAALDRAVTGQYAYNGEPVQSVEWE